MSKKEKKVVIVDFQILTSCGLGINNLWKHLTNNKTAISKNKRFVTEHFISQYSATVPELSSNINKTYIQQMLEMLRDSKSPIIKTPDLLFLGTTVGEIDYLENSVLNNQNHDFGKSKPQYILKNCIKLFEAEKGVHISAACTSSSVGIIQAAEMIKNNYIEHSIVLGCDEVSEFVFSGFSALMALSPKPAKPFDKNRKGLTLGEGAAYIYLTSEDFANKNNLPILAYVSGTGISNDANHITGPSRDGSGLAQAIRTALKNAELQSKEIDVISAHGTATSFNDSMEMKAFKSVFEKPKPTYSVKGCIGHTMGAAGIIEVITAVKSFQEKQLPPTVGLTEPDEESEGWVYKKPKYDNSNYCLSVNSGFGGINSAIILHNR